ncbi:unnamed protein product [Ilex paraguariensis]|uniref:Uncharacterized protein n=1 Tax=Ilex paraguariensis TaxID=185542 RepID=A0ABC8U776_9AQUA
MKMRRRTQIILSLVIQLLVIPSHLHARFDRSQGNSPTVANEVRVGVILDLGSWVGKTIHSCITMAISDFYAVNSHHKTRIALHTRDSKGEPLQALSAVIHLLSDRGQDHLLMLKSEGRQRHSFPNRSLSANMDG